MKVITLSTFPLSSITVYDGFRSNDASLNKSLWKLLDKVGTSEYGYGEVDANVNKAHEVKDKGEKIDDMLREI